MCAVVSVSCGVAAPNVGVESYPEEVEGRPCCSGFCKNKSAPTSAGADRADRLCSPLSPHRFFVFP